MCPKAPARTRTMVVVATSKRVGTVPPTVASSPVARAAGTRDQHPQARQWRLVRRATTARTVHAAEGRCDPMATAWMRTTNMRRVAEVEDPTGDDEVDVVAHTAATEALSRAELVLPAGRRLRHEGHADFVRDEDVVAGPGAQGRAQGGRVLLDDGRRSVELLPRLCTVDEPGQPGAEEVGEHRSRGTAGRRAGRGCPRCPHVAGRRARCRATRPEHSSSAASTSCPVAT